MNLKPGDYVDVSGLSNDDKDRVYHYLMSNGVIDDFEGECYYGYNYFFIQHCNEFNATEMFRAQLMTNELQLSELLSDTFPSVGDVVEIAESTPFLRIRHPEGHKVKIHSKFTDDRGVELFAFIDDLGKVGGVATARCFRPAKTDKEKVVDKAIESLTTPNTVDSMIKTYCESLYDAGMLGMPDEEEQGDD